MVEYDISQLVGTLSELGYQYRTEGKEYYLQNCPFCGSDDKKKRCFCFDSETGQYFCHRCEHKGNLKTFRREMGLDPFEEVKEFRRLDQKVIRTFVPQLTEQDKYYKAYEEKRKVPAEILAKYRVGKIKDGRLGICRTYEYVDTDGEIVNVKYINSKKDMKTEKDCKPVYYGLQFLDFSLEYLFVTEGEDDCHCLAACGYKNIVSLPYGASCYNEHMANINKQFKKIWLFYDNDKAGSVGAEKFAQKAGVWKCKRIVLPFKDVREAYINGFRKEEFDLCMEQAITYKMDSSIRLRPALNVSERIALYEKECRQNKDGITFGFPVLDNVTGGLRGGDVFNISANPGCYKTTLLMNLLQRAVNVSLAKGIFMSLEMQAEAQTEREIQIAVGNCSAYNLRQNVLQNSAEWNNLKIGLEVNTMSQIFVSDENQLTVDDIVAVIKTTESINDIKFGIVGIDYLDFVVSKAAGNTEKVNDITLAIKNKIAKALNLPVIYLGQTTRESDDRTSEPSSRSAKGGTAIEANCDFQIMLWEYEGDTVGKFTKHRRLYNATPYQYFKLEMDKTSYTISNIVPIAQPVCSEKKSWGG